MDITILYYTANIIPEFFANNVREQLLLASNGIPIISVSQKPIDFGENICVEDLTPSIYNIYVQIYMGANNVKTKYVVCCEDDSLYVPEHFTRRPCEDAFAYNVNRWNVDETGVFFYRHRRGMCMCIAPTQLLIDTLEVRLRKYSDPFANIPHFGEPGRYEIGLGLPPVKLEEFDTKIPCLHFNHMDGQGQRRKLRKVDKIVGDLEYWGNAKELWNRIHGNNNQPNL